MVLTDVRTITDIYINLAVRVKLHLDWLKNGCQGRNDNWDSVLKFWDQMAYSSQYNGVTKAEFAEIDDAAARHRPPTSKESHPCPDEDFCFRVSGPPLPPTQEPSKSHF